MAGKYDHEILDLYFRRMNKFDTTLNQNENIL